MVEGFSRRIVVPDLVSWLPQRAENTAHSAHWWCLGRKPLLDHLLQMLQDKLQALLSTGQYGDVAKMLDRAELESPNPLVLEDWPHAAHMLGHIYNKKLEDARFLWKRIPASVKQNSPELTAVWKLLQHLWQRYYPGVWQALSGYRWSPALQPFVDAVAAKTRAELLDLISLSYTSVKPSKVAAICGLTEQGAVDVCQAEGWAFNPASGTFAVVPKASPAPVLDTAGNLQSLTEYMVHLEGH